MPGKRLASLLRISPSSQLSSVSNPVDEGKSRSLGRKAVSTVLICLTGGVGLSAVDDLVIYHGCSSKAMDTASNHKAMVDAIGEPITKGAWYNASLAVAHQRKSVSCSFPVSGPRGEGMLRLKAIRNGDDSWLSFFRPRDFHILVMDAVLNIPANEKSQRTMKIDLLDNLGSSELKACTRAQHPCTQ
ncbi:hypothetical protein Drorol1_Dr00024823 [Drosera rotundifolia]